MSLNLMTLIYSKEIRVRLYLQSRTNRKEWRISNSSQISDYFLSNPLRRNKKATVITKTIFTHIFIFFFFQNKEAKCTFLSGERKNVGEVGRRTQGQGYRMTGFLTARQGHRLCAGAKTYVSENRRCVSIVNKVIVVRQVMESF